MLSSGRKISRAKKLANFCTIGVVFSSSYGYSAENDSPDNSDKTMWGFIIPMSDFKYASEVVSIDQAYPAFKEWSASSGTSQKNWYMNPEEKYVYHKPVKK